MTTEEMPVEFWQGVEQFNQREFYDCHDTLEAIWMNAVSSEKNFFQGILQIAVALHHLRHENWRGAVILMGEGIHRLYAYPDDYGGIDVEGLTTQAAALLKQLHEAGAEQVGAIAQRLFAVPPSEAVAASMPVPVIQRLVET